MRDPYAQNRANWEARVDLHRESSFYDLPGFLAGTSGRLPQQDVDEVGAVAGKSLLHLQCHLGLDSISWALRGALVTGVDFSPKAIATARKLAAELGLDTRFICADVYDLPSDLDTDFQVIYSTRGVLCWLGDLSAWAMTVARHLAPEGLFYLADDHPVLDLLGEAEPGLDWHGRYFHDPEPVRCENPGSYTGPDPRFPEPVSYQWHHDLGEIVTALAQAGLVIEFLREWPWAYYRARPWMVEGPDGTWRVPGGNLPLSFSLRAHHGP